MKRLRWRVWPCAAVSLIQAAETCRDRGNRIAMRDLARDGVGWLRRKGVVR